MSAAAFRVSYAANPAFGSCMPNPLLPFREDLDPAVQSMNVAAAHAKSASEREMVTWKNTCATRESHQHMLRALVVEAARYRRSALIEPMCREYRQGLLDEVDSRMRDNDAYVAVLTGIARLRLFT